MIIRKAKKEDFQQYFRLKKEFSKIYQEVSRYKIKAPSSNECFSEFKDLFKKNIFFYVAEEKNEIAAYFIGSIIKSQHYDSYGYISDMFVSKKYQGKGISSLFKNKFFDFLKKSRIKNCRLDVNPENKKAIKVYKKWGFSVDKYRMNLEAI